MAVYWELTEVKSVKYPDGYGNDLRVTVKKTYTGFDKFWYGCSSAEFVLVQGWKYKQMEKLEKHNEEL